MGYWVGSRESSARSSPRESSMPNSDVNIGDGEAAENVEAARVGCGLLRTRGADVMEPPTSVASLLGGAGSGGADTNAQELDGTQYLTQRHAQKSVTLEELHESHDPVECVSTQERLQLDTSLSTTQRQDPDLRKDSNLVNEEPPKAETQKTATDVPREGNMLGIHVLSSMISNEDGDAGSDMDIESDGISACGEGIESGIKESPAKNDQERTHIAFARAWQERSIDSRISNTAPEPPATLRADDHFDPSSVPASVDVTDRVDSAVAEGGYTEDSLGVREDLRSCAPLSLPASSPLTKRSIDAVQEEVKSRGIDNLDFGTFSDLPLSPLTDLSSDSGDRQWMPSGRDASADAVFEIERNLRQSGSVDSSTVSTPLSDFSEPRSPPPIDDDKDTTAVLDDAGSNSRRSATPGPSSSSQKCERKLSPARRRSGSLSPLRSHTEAEALSIFGSSMSLYSISGPPGGMFVGLGTLQCEPAGNGCVDVSVRIDANVQLALSESAGTVGLPANNMGKVRKSSGKTNEKEPNRVRERAREKTEASGSGSGSVKRTASRLVSDGFSKPAMAKRTISNKMEVDLNVEDPQKTSCHICRRRNELPKMSCTTIRAGGTQCVFRYCKKCIERRFPDVHFDAYNDKFVCPRCAGWCNCAECKSTRQVKKANIVLDESRSSKESNHLPSKDVHHVSPSYPVHADPLSSLSMSRAEGTSEDTHDKSLTSPIPVVRARKASMKAASALKRIAEEAFLEEEFTSEVVQDDVGRDSDLIIANNANPGSRPGPSMPSSKRQKTSTPGQTSRPSEVYLHGHSSADFHRICHQCRGKKDSYAKMICSGVQESGKKCMALYCDRCIAKRYPDIVFTPRGSFYCPKCSGTCNCDVCTPRRGEVYIRPREFQEMLEAKGKVPAGVSGSTPQRKAKASRESKEEPANIGDEAEEWIRLQHEELTAADEDRPPRRIKAFVGEWSSSWGALGTSVEMESADAQACQDAGSSTGASSLSVSGEPKRRLYVGSTADLQRAFVSDEAGSTTSSAHSQAVSSVAAIRSRSGRAIKPSEKVRPRDSSEDALRLTAARKRHRRSSAGSDSLPSARMTSSSPLTALSPTTPAKERSSIVLLGSPLTDCNDLDESDNVLDSYRNIDSPVMNSGVQGGEKSSQELVDFTQIQEGRCGARRTAGSSQG